MIYWFLFLAHFLSALGIIFSFKKCHPILFYGVSTTVFLFGFVAANVIIADGTTFHNIKLKLVGYSLYGFYSILGGAIFSLLLTKIRK